MKLKLLVFCLCIVIAVVGARAFTEDLVEEQDATLNFVLNNMTVVADRQMDTSGLADRLPYTMRIVTVPTSFVECGDDPISCPKFFAYIAVSEFAEYPVQKLFKLPESYGWSFVSWDSDPRSLSSEDYFVVTLRKQVIADDTSQGWWSFETYTLRINLNSASVSRVP